jgi:hypothetical protein
MSCARKVIFVWAIFLVVGLAFTPGVCANMLQNPSFETLGPDGSPTSLTGKFVLGNSAAQDWFVWNNSDATTTTELLSSTLPGGGTNMIHFTTDGGRNGLIQYFLPSSTGPDHVIGSAWIYVLSGQVQIGTGDDGSTLGDAFSTTTGEWELLHAPNGVAPANEFIIYSYNGPVEFYADNASVSVPEPTTMLLLGLGLMGIAGIRRKFQN